MRTRTKINYLSVRSFDTSTDIGRANERYRLAAWSIVANFISKGLAVLAFLLSVKFTIQYLGEERLGIWMTISSFVGIFTFLDLGVGNALTNRVANIAASEDSGDLKKTISSGFSVLCIISLFIGLIMTIVAAHLPWQLIIKVVDTELYGEIRMAGIIFGILFGLHIIASGVQKIFYGLQQGYIVHLITGFGAIFSIISIWIASHQKAGIPVLLCSTLGVQLAVSLSLIEILRKRNFIKFPVELKGLTKESKYLLKSGGLFFILQLGAMVSLGADSLIIANTIGAEHVVIYVMVQRIFQFVSQPLSIFNAPLWSAYADANARKDFKFIKSTLIRSVLTTAIMGMILVSIVYFSINYLFEFWTSNNINPPQILIVTFAIWTLVEVIGNSFGTFFNGCNLIWPQVLTVSLLIILSLPTKIFIISNFGLSTMIAAHITIYLLVQGISYGYVFRKEVGALLK